MESLKRIEDNAIRRQLDQKSNKWYFSIVDSVGITVKSTDPRNYWKVLKNRLKKAQNKLVTECNQLKMMASDGKFYLTDVADEETIIKIIKLISPESPSLFRQYFNNLTPYQGFPLGSSTDTENNKKLSYPQFEDKEEEMMLMVDGYREKDFLFVQAFVAGVDIENLSVSVTCKTVTIKGERKSFYKDYEFNSYGGVASVAELYWGKFSRIITLSFEVEINKIEASEYHGLLTIKLPIMNKNRSKTIKVRNQT